MVEFSKVEEPWWDDKPVAIVGTGPSLAGFDFRVFQHTRCHVLAVNGAALDLPLADAAFSLDLKWIDRFADIVATMMPLYLAVPEHRRKANAVNLRFVQSRDGGLSEQPDRIECGYTSGFGALNLAYLKRARHVILFGFDYREGHYCPDRYRHHLPHKAWDGWGRHFDTAVPQLERAGVEVINASAESAITAFARCSPAAGELLLGPHVDS